MKDQEEMKSKLALESKRSKKFEVYKLNHVRNRISGGRQEKTDEKKNKDFLDSNTKLESRVCTLKSDLDKANV